MTDAGVLWTRKLVFFSLALVLFAEVLVSLDDGAPWIIWLLRLLPLLVFVPGMLADGLRSYIWLCFVCLLYFMNAVLRMFAQPQDPVTITGLVAIVTLFISAMMYVRWRAQQLKREMSHD
jgi:uncharacterized membrane protein